MKNLIALGFASVLIAGTAFGQASGQKSAQPATPSGMDMSKMGPWTRKVKNEKALKKEIEQFFKEEDAIAKKGDFAAALARVDFPVYMVTDDANGMAKAEVWNQEKYTASMKPFYENMPKDAKTTHKPSITVLSDSLVNIVDDFTMSMGKQKMSGRNASVLVKVDGKWKWKVMAEAGWGEPAAK